MSPSRDLLARCLLLLAFLVVASPVGASSAPITLAADATRIDIAEGLDWWPTPLSGVSLAEAQRAMFAPAPPGPGHGVRAGEVWFRAVLRNEAGDARDLLLEVAFNKLDFLDVHLVRGDGRTESWFTGEARPFATRPVSSTPFLFPFELAAGEEITVYLRVESGTVVNVPLAVHDAAAYVGVASHLHGWLGVFYGLVLGLLAYNTYLFRATREVAFLNYIAGGALATGYFLSVDGYLASWLPERPGVAQALLFFCGTLSAAFTLFFSRSFLALRQVAPRLDHTILLAASFMALLAPLLMLMPAVAAMALTILCSVGMAVLMSVGGVLALRAGFAPARWFVLAVSIHLLVLTAVSLALVDLAPWSFGDADTLHRFGFLANLFCFTLAIGDRIGMLDAQKRAAEERVLAAAADARARNEFLSRMSHELRTPMTGILGMAELLEHTELTPGQRRYTGTLRYSGEMLLNLINDILDHARLQGGRLQPAREAFDLLRLVDDCRLLFAQQPRDPAVPLCTDIGAGITRVAVGDAQRVRQVLIDVLSQAFRQTSRGAVTLRLRALDPPGWLRIEVEAAAEGREEAVRQLADAGGGQRGGLGLAISRELVGAMGGRMGIGGDQVTLIWIELPLHAAS